MSGEAGPEDLLDAVVRRAKELDSAGALPLRRVLLRTADTSVEVEWQPGPAPVALPQNTVDTAIEPFTEEPTVDEVALCAPAVGTFYRGPEPGAPPFVEVGDVVSLGQQVAIIEAMKLMNPIEADRAGRVVRFAAGDGEAVEFGQPLLLLADVE